MPSFYKLGIVDHPKAAEVVLVPDETLVQRQIRADCVLQRSSGRCRTGKEREKEGKISSSWQVSNLVVWLVGCGGGRDSNGHMYTFGEIKQTNHLV